MRRLLLVVLLLASSLALAGDRQSVLIRTPKPYDKVVAAIQAMGGTVTYQYKYVNGIAAQLPLSALPKIEALVGADNLSKDELQTIPAPSNRLGQATALADSVGEVSGDSALPTDYDFDNALMHTNTLRASGYTGSGIVVAVIDSGYRPMFTHVPASRVLAGLNMVPATAEPGGVQVPAVNNANYPHGTQVAGLIAASTGLCFTGTSNFATLAVAYGAGTANYAGCGAPGTYTVVWMYGTAPAAKIFPVKVFPTSGAGAPSSRIIQAMEAVIDARVAYDNGDATNGVNIRAANMSLGGPTGIAGRGLEDEAADAMLAHDIVLSVAAGNDGFSNMTISEPGTSFSALTVGAASNPANWRMALGTFYTPCAAAPYNYTTVKACVETYYPDNSMQMADFSSRGPTHDGRIKPDVVANGSFNFVKGSGPSGSYYGVGSGTSFATPLVTGLAASLRQAVPTATARQIRNAIIASANPNLIPTATVFHQGAGFVDATAALALLQAGGVPDTVRTDFPYARSVVDNVTNAGLQVSNGFQSRTVTVRPGELAEITYNVDKNTDKLFVSFHNVTPGATQNAFFGDDVYLRIQSSFVEGKDYRTDTFLNGDSSFSFDKPMQGLWRITPSGDYTNAGPITFTVDVWTTNDPSPQQSAKNKIAADEWQYLSFSVKPGTKALDVLGSWINQYDSYPVNDIDFYLVAPDGTVFTDCATGNAPERCSVATPQAGTWQVVANGFAVNTLTTPGGREVYTLRISADGTVLPAK